MEHLNGLQKPLQRNKILSVMALAKRAISDIIASFVKDSVVNVKLTNKQELDSLSKGTLQSLDKIQKGLRKIEFLLRVPMKVIVPPVQIDKEDLPKEEYFTSINDTIKDVIKGLSNVTDAVGKIKLTLSLPRTQEVTGNVKISNQLDFPIERIEKALLAIENKISKIKLDIKTPAIKFPSIPEGISPRELKKMIDVLADIKKELKDLPSNMPQAPEAEYPMRVKVDNFPTPKYPNPVTNININGLRGVAQSRPITVTTTATAMPSDPIDNRRSMIIFNNDSTKTLYIGGSGVSTANGLPVLAQTFSPPIDAGVKMLIYGVVSSGTLNARILEVSMDDIGA